MIRTILGWLAGSSTADRAASRYASNTTRQSAAIEMGW